MTQRRHFLKVVAAASMSACAPETESSSESGTGTLTGGGSTSQHNLPEGFELLGNLTGVPVGAVLEVAGLDLFVGRDAGGVYAMTSRCTHENCNMIANDGVIAPGVIRCRCHGSLYDANG